MKQIFDRDFPNFILLEYNVETENDSFESEVIDRAG